MDTGELDARTITISPEQAARRLGVEVSTLRNWRYRGSGPPFVRIGNRRVRYRLHDLAEYLEERSRNSTSDPGPDA